MRDAAFVKRGAFASSGDATGRALQQANAEPVLEPDTLLPTADRDRPIRSAAAVKLLASATWTKAWMSLIRSIVIVLSLALAFSAARG